jgi:hypothetical protein
MSTSRNSGFLPTNAFLPSANLTVAELFSTPGPLDIGYAVLWWSSILLGVAQQFAPVGKMSLLHSCLLENQLLSLRIAYYGILLWNAAK